MDGRRGRFIGNAVAPPLAQFIGQRILEIEAERAQSEPKAKGAVAKLVR